MSHEFYAYTGRVSKGSRMAPFLDQHKIREMTNRGQTPARTPFALDNGAYIDWRSDRAFDVQEYQETLKACIPLQPDFLIIPDKVAGGLDSLRFSLSWIPTLRKLTRSNIPLALAVQDGMEPDDIEPYLGEFEVLFLGGSRPWKYRTGERWCRWAARHGLPVHIGAIGSMVGVRWAKAIHASSVDSTSPLWSATAMVNWLKALEETPAQNVPIITPKINPNQKRPTRKQNGSSREDIIGSTLANSFHHQMMGDVQSSALNQIRREFGDAHLREKVSDAEFLALESTASAVYDLLRLETLTLPPFHLRTLQSQETLDRWIDQLSETDDYMAFKHAYADLERAYRNKHVSAFDTVTLQNMCQALFTRFFAKAHPGGFGLIIDPKTQVAGRRQPKSLPLKNRKKARIGAMQSITETLVSIWKSGENIDWGRNKQGLGGYLAVVAAVNQAAQDPEAPTEFLGWLLEQNGNARGQLPNTAVYDIAPYRNEVLSNPNVSATVALRLAASTGYGSHTKPDKVLYLLQNPSFSMFCMEDPAFMDKLWDVIVTIHPYEIPAALRHFQEVPGFAEWLGPEVGHYTYKNLFKINKNAFAGPPIPESVIVYGHGVVDFNFRTVKDQKRRRRLYRSLAEAEKIYGPELLALSDQMTPKEPRKKTPKPTISGTVRVSRIGAISPTTQTLLDMWRSNRSFGLYDVLPEFGNKQPAHLDAEFREAASSPEVPSSFLLWLLENGSFRAHEEVMKNPNLSLEDAFVALDERNFKAHWKRQKGYAGYYVQLPAGVWLLDNPSFQLFLLEDPAVYERLFHTVKFIGHVASKFVYQDRVEAFLSHPVMQSWLGLPTVYTFKKAKRVPLREDPDKALLPLSITRYENGVIRVEHSLSERKDRTPLFRTLKDYLDNPSFSPPMTESQFLAKSDQASAKRKGK